MELAKHGESGPLKFGKISPSETQKILQDPDIYLWPSVGSESNIPTNITADLFEFYFTETGSPVLYGLNIQINYTTSIWGQSREVHNPISLPRAGKTLWKFGKLKWADIQTLPEAIRLLERNSYEIGSGPEKQVFLIWTFGKRQLSFQYLLEGHQREENQYEFDYFLHKVHLADYGRLKLRKKSLDKLLMKQH